MIGPARGVPMRRRSYLFILAGVLAIGAVSLLVVPIFHAGRITWPEITDYDRLFSEAQALSQRNGLGFVDKTEWPPSIRQLSPRAVRVDTDFVEVVVSTGGIDAGWGFYIYTAPMFDPQRVRSPIFKPTVHPRIYRCTVIE